MNIDSITKDDINVTEYTPYHRIAAAVIAQAIDDFATNTRIGWKDKREATRWLFYGGLEGFLHRTGLCSSIDADYIKVKAKKLSKKGV